MGEISNFNKAGKKPTVLVSPLDWGLGHTTRCIPIIRELLNHDCTVIIACNSVQKTILSSEFPQCTYVNLPGYDMLYGHSRRGTLGRILLQMPKILIKIKRENRWLNTFLSRQEVHAVISDNRFGFYSTQVPSVFITHQLSIETGFGWAADRMADWLNDQYIARFNTCWVPDYAGAQAMAGKLSNPATLPNVPIQYLGGLSRLQPCESPEKPGKLLIILSGPEPQRTLFENLVLQQVQQLAVPAVLVRGLPANTGQLSASANLTVYNHAPAGLLNQLVCEAEWIISRSGYTTVMDLLKLGKKSILVPTPGQTEQEYLAVHLHGQLLAYTMQQKNFSLQKALDAAREFPYKQPSLAMDNYKPIVREWIRSIGGKSF